VSDSTSERSRTRRRKETSVNRKEGGRIRVGIGRSRREGREGEYGRRKKEKK
jgi:hypothetical protein